MISMFICVDKYIEAKDKRLCNEIHEKIYAIFGDRSQLVDVAYSGYKVGYENIAIPDKMKSKDWTSNYGNLTKMYRIFYKGSDWSGPYDYEDGWNLCVLKYDYEGVYQSWIFPYAVGFIKQEYNLGYTYMPSVEEAVNEAYQFYTSNEKSDFYETFEKGCVDNAWSEIYAAENEYYYMAKDKGLRFMEMGAPLFEQYPKDFPNNSEPYPYQRGFMYNGYYKVFIASTQPTTWTITKRKWNPDEKEKNNLWVGWAIGLTILFLCVIIPLWIIDVKQKRIREESLYDKLKRSCNPSNFLKDYDKDKVDKANTIYQRLLEISADDMDALNELQQTAVKDLGICLVDIEKIKELREKANPKNYMKPYNAEKVALANELYSKLSKDGLTYSELSEIENRINKLLI